MPSRECEELLNQLIIVWNEDRETMLNLNDIEAIKHLMLENQIQQDTITKLKIQVSAREEFINKALDEITKDKMEQFDDYVIYLLEKYEGLLKGENNER